ncbi:MAG: cell division protein FtsQ/DivIB [Armatimonadetes bacterium]|nr:cell division protein FtsQ/DivIB [Armatimonadota bacterium]
MDGGHRPALGALQPKQQRRLARLKALVFLGFVFLAIEISYIALASPRLTVREVVVRGDPAIAPMVAQAIELPPNTSILRAPLELVRAQAESCPAVREAKVKRGFPARIAVVVERREPVAAIRRATEAFLLDKDGVTFQVPGEWGWGLPELIGPNLATGDLGVESAESEINTLMVALAALGPDPTLRASRLQLGADGLIEVTLESGAQVNLGGPENLKEKAKLLAAAVEQLGAQRIARVDLSDPASAYWEPREDMGRVGGR